MTSPKKTYLPSYLPSYLQHLPIYLPQTTPLRNGPRDLWPLRHLIRNFWAQICSPQRLPSYRIFQAFTNLLNLSKIKWFFCFQCTFLHTTEIICSEQTEFDFVSLPIFTGWHFCIFRVTRLYFVSSAPYLPSDSWNGEIALLQFQASVVAKPSTVSYSRIFFSLANGGSGGVVVSRR